MKLAQVKKHIYSTISSLEKTIDLIETIVPGDVYLVKHRTYVFGGGRRNKEEVVSGVLRIEDLKKVSIGVSILAAEKIHYPLNGYVGTNGRLLLGTPALNIRYNYIESIEVFQCTEAPLVINYAYVSDEFKRLYFGT